MLLGPPARLPTARPAPRLYSNPAGVRPCPCCRGLIIVGILAIVSFFVGFVGSYYKRWCLGVYLMLGTLVTLAELGIVLTLFFNLDGVLSNMETHAYNSLPEAQRASIEAEAKANDEPVSNIWQWDRCGGALSWLAARQAGGPMLARCALLGLCLLFVPRGPSQVEGE